MTNTITDEQIMVSVIYALVEQKNRKKLIMQLREVRMITPDTATRLLKMYGLEGA